MNFSIQYFDTELVQKLAYKNLFLQLWAQLFWENLGIRRLAKNFEGILTSSKFVFLKATARKTTSILVIYIFS